MHLHHTFQLSISKCFKNHYFFYYLFVESQQCTQHWEVQSKPQSYGLSFANLNDAQIRPLLDVPVKNLKVDVCMCMLTLRKGKRNLSELPCYLNS